jgi:hypothetical protein
MKRFALLLFAVAATSMVFGQIKMPAPSPLSTVTQKIGLTTASITYSRPGVKGRKIFGELVAYDRMWRTGANASTKLKLEDDVTIEGHDVPAGEYGLFTIPGKDKWTIIIHTNTAHNGTGGSSYKQEEDLVRFDVVPNNAYPVKIETLTFNFTDVRDDQCYIELLWENTQVRFQVKTEVDKTIMAEINEKMKGVSAATYYQSARYYLEHDKDLNMALEWINKALEEEEKFWVVRQKALILAKMERYEEAIEAAKLSKKLAQEAENLDYVDLNNKSIEEWSGKL